MEDESSLRGVNPLEERLIQKPDCPRASEKKIRGAEYAKNNNNLVNSSIGLNPRLMPYVYFSKS